MTGCVPLPFANPWVPVTLLGAFTVAAVAALDTEKNMVRTLETSGNMFIHVYLVCSLMFINVY